MPSSACYPPPRHLHPFPTRRSSDLNRSHAAPVPTRPLGRTVADVSIIGLGGYHLGLVDTQAEATRIIHEAIDAGITLMDNAWEYHERSEEHTSELQSLAYLVCRLLLATPPPDISTLSLHDALPISTAPTPRRSPLAPSAAPAPTSPSLASAAITSGSSTRRPRLLASSMRQSMPASPSWTTRGNTTRDRKSTRLNSSH